MLAVLDIRWSIEVDLHYSDQRSENSSLFLLLHFKIGGLTQGMATYRILGLRCICLHIRMLNSGNSDSMIQILKQVTVLVVLCVMLKQSFAFFIPFGLGYISIQKINIGRFII